MALKRSFLTAMGIEEEKADEIIKGHRETVDALQEQIDTLKKSADRLPAVEKELNDLKKQSEGENVFEVKYKKVKEDFDNYKKGIEAEKTKAEKTEAFKSVLKEIGIADKYVNSIMKVTQLDTIELENGKAKVDAEALKTEWADFIAETVKEGATTATPPAQQPSIDLDKLSDEEYYKQTYETTKGTK